MEINVFVGSVRWSEELSFRANHRYNLHNHLFSWDSSPAGRSFSYSLLVGKKGPEKKILLRTRVTNRLKRKKRPSVLTFSLVLLKTRGDCILENL